jgi:hypothetical protein
MILRAKARTGEFASVLFITLILAGLLGLTLGSYLYWVRTQNLLVSESQAWNTALTIAEAGIEEGMAQLNVALGHPATATNFTPSATTNWGAPSGDIFGPVTRTLNGGSYSAIIQPVPPTNAWIFATGYTTLPLVDRPITRTVRVMTAVSFLFPNAVSARLGVTNAGNNIMVDSYDSSDSYHSTPNGLYDPATRKAGGDVATTDGIINVANANIYGKLRTGPQGSYKIGPNGRVGDLPSNWSGTSGIQPGWYLNDFNMDFPDVLEPYTFGFPPTNVTTNGNTTYILGNGEYMMGDLTLSAGDQLLVVGKAKLYLTGNLDMKAQGQKAAAINITNDATLTLYVAGPTANFTQVNTVGNASTFAYYGLPTNTKVTWSGNAQYLGTVYAPNADFNLGGGGANTMDFQGSAVVRSVNMNGHFNVHYDENLRRAGPTAGYKVIAWRELAPN